MDAHMNANALDGYLTRTLDGTALRALDDHVVGCLDCSLAVEAAGLDADRWQRRGPLGRLVRVPTLSR
jgi:hypothetical protein